ncbi:hypothetical protein KP509_10G013400 [Ceratopteris richardii]|nr:hypothetical protein KP509_10G013400 [Ceratopteris richardii]
MISSIATVLQDELNPALAVRVAIYNAVSPNASLAIVQNAYPKNARVAIKEPYLKRAADGGLAIRVDIPANVEILDGDACQRSGGKSSFDDPISLKEKGNAFFGEQKWTRAIDCYGRCIRSIVGQGSENENGKLLVIAYSNRAEAFIRLESYFEALTDCEAALSIDSHHTKSEYRKGRALQGLKRFEEAILCFESLLSRHPESREVQDVLDSMKRSCPDQA